MIFYFAQPFTYDISRPSEMYLLVLSIFAALECLPYHMPQITLRLVFKRRLNTLLCQSVRPAVRPSICNIIDNIIKLVLLLSFYGGLSHTKTNTIDVI